MDTVSGLITRSKDLPTTWLTDWVYLINPKNIPSVTPICVCTVKCKLDCPSSMPLDPLVHSFSSTRTSCLKIQRQLRVEWRILLQLLFFECTVTSSLVQQRSLLWLQWWMLSVVSLDCRRKKTIERSHSSEKVVHKYDRDVLALFSFVLSRHSFSNDTWITALSLILTSLTGIQELSWFSPVANSNPQPFSILIDYTKHTPLSASNWLIFLTNSAWGQITAHYTDKLTKTDQITLQLLRSRHKIYLTYNMIKPDAFGKKETRRADTM